jgi:hypothetical protein
MSSSEGESSDTDAYEYDSDTFDCPEDTDLSVLPLGIYTFYKQKRDEQGDAPVDNEMLMDNTKELMILMFSGYVLENHPKPFMLEDGVAIDAFVEREISHLKEKAILSGIALCDSFLEAIEATETLVENYRQGMQQQSHDTMFELFQKHGLQGMFQAITTATAGSSGSGACITCCEADPVPFPAECKHVVVCAACSLKLDLCPTCRAPRVTGSSI